MDSDDGNCCYTEFCIYLKYEAYLRKGIDFGRYVFLRSNRN